MVGWVRWLAILAVAAAASATLCALGPSRAQAARAREAATDRCYAAAARDAAHRCAVRRARPRAVQPTPEDALLLADGPCEPLPGPAADALDACAFGAPLARRTQTVLLLGDSHARHWRAALDVAARAQRWRAISMVRPGCPFSRRVPASAGPDAQLCHERNAGAIAWLAAHPQVDTVFLSAWAEPPWGFQGGMANYGGGVEDFGAMLDLLPASVRRVVALRDTPGARPGTGACVERALRRGADAAGRCAIPRPAALLPDPQAAAARARTPRAQVIDLTRYFCGPSACFPVVGGAYVYKDFNHINSVFARSLGPYLARALR